MLQTNSGTVAKTKSCYQQMESGTEAQKTAMSIMETFTRKLNAVTKNIKKRGKTRTVTQSRTLLPNRKMETFTQTLNTATQKWKLVPKHRTLLPKNGNCYPNTENCYEKAHGHVCQKTENCYNKLERDPKPNTATKKWKLEPKHSTLLQKTWKLVPEN